MEATLVCKVVQSSEGWGMLCFENASRKVSFQGGFVKQCDTQTHTHASRKWNEVLLGTSSGTSSNWTNLWHMHPIYFLLWRREGYSYKFVSKPQLRAGLHSSVKMLFHKYLKYFKRNQINLLIQFRIKLTFIKKMRLAGISSANEISHGKSSQI